MLENGKLWEGNNWNEGNWEGINGENVTKVFPWTKKSVQELLEDGTITQSTKNRLIIENNDELKKYFFVDIHWKIWVKKAIHSGKIVVPSELLIKLFTSLTNRDIDDSNVYNIWKIVASWDELRISSDWNCLEAKIKEGWQEILRYIKDKK